MTNGALLFLVTAAYVCLCHAAAAAACCGLCGVAMLFYNEKRVRTHVDEKYGSADANRDRSNSRVSGCSRRSEA